MYTLKPDTAWQSPQKTMPVKPPAKTRPLTSKQKAFIKHLIDNPKATKTQAYIASYNHNGTIKTAHEQASITASKPQVKQALEQNSHLFESTVVQTVKDWGNSDNTRQRELALQASYWGHDKVHGKATNRVESVQSGIQISIDLTSMLDTTEVDDTL